MKPSVKSSGDGQKICVTGANGFVGRSTVRRLREAGYGVLEVTRSDIGDIDRGTDWTPILKQGVETVVHLANLAHASPDPSSSEEPLDSCRRVNVDGTVQLARQARQMGVRRFVFVSSLKVLGETGVNLSPGLPYRPRDHYARSKSDAEQVLRAIYGRLELVVLRPPLVYGPDVRANFLEMLTQIDRLGLLPLGSVNNRRSLIYVENLADAIAYSIDAPAGTYHPKDVGDLSTPELISAIADAIGTKTHLLPVPVWMLRALGSLPGKFAKIQKLTGDFTSDGSMADWTPPYSMGDGLSRTAAWYRDRGAS